MRGSDDGSAIALSMHAAYQATVPSVCCLGRKTPLRLRVFGRDTTGARGTVDIGSVGAEEAAGVVAATGPIVGVGELGVSDAACPGDEDSPAEEAGLE